MFRLKSRCLLIIQLVFRVFWLSSPFFSTILWTRHGVWHPSSVGILWCLRTHPIDPMGSHLLHYAHSNKYIGTCDVVHDTFVAIFVRCWLPHGTWTTTCGPFNHVELLLSMNQHYVHQICNLHLNYCCHCQNQCERIYLVNLAQLKDLLLLMQLKPKKNSYHD
jgi:hypothetical protein